MKKALLTIVSLTLLLPHHNFAMQKQTSKEKAQLSAGFCPIYPNIQDVTPSTINPQNRETIGLIEKNNEEEITTDEEDETTECAKKISSTLWYATAGTFVAIIMTGFVVGFYFRALAQK